MIRSRISNKSKLTVFEESIALAKCGHCSLLKFVVKFMGVFVQTWFSAEMLRNIRVGVVLN